jgi:hypothetical protein
MPWMRKLLLDLHEEMPRGPHSDGERAIINSNLKWLFSSEGILQGTNASVTPLSYLCEFETSFRYTHFASVLSLPSTQK